MKEVHLFFFNEFLNRSNKIIYLYFTTYKIYTIILVFGLFNNIGRENLLKSEIFNGKLLSIQNLHRR
jgi:hypothetical protein